VVVASAGRPSICRVAAIYLLRDCSIRTVVGGNSLAESARVPRPRCRELREGRAEALPLQYDAVPSSLSSFGGFAIGGRELPELIYRGGHGLQREVDLFGCGVAAEAEAQAGASFVGGQANRGEHVRRLDRA
jgi:hypothetical protein